MYYKIVTITTVCHFALWHFGHPGRGRSSTVDVSVAGYLELKFVTVRASRVELARSALALQRIERTLPVLVLYIK